MSRSPNNTVTRQDGSVSSAQQSSHGWTGLPPAAGRLLISAPALRDAPFARSIVYLLEHGDVGTVGVILNRPSHTPVGQVLPDWHDLVSEPAVIFGGGPVMPDGALCLGEFRGEGPGIRQVFGQLATVDLDADAALVTSITGRMRVYAGHAGWAPGQLADELTAGAWYVVAGSPDDVFSDEPGRLWRRVLGRQPPPLRLLATYPPDPLLN
jgi:putative transcriptional regulator